ncbi:MAG: hypothetical protein KAT65_28885 [Methanophagales archaeon]|nr:hypothetical protein [Methanophagales archaeon]
MPTDNDESKEVLRKFYEKWGGKINVNLLPQPIRAFMKLAEKEIKETRET